MDAAVLIVGLAWLAAGPLVGWWIAEEKGRSGVEGAVLGFFLGPIGWVVEGLLPVVRPAGAAATGSGHGSTALSAPVAPAPFATAPRPTSSTAVKKCPDCAEMVKVEARICRYCRHEFPAVHSDVPNPGAIRSEAGPAIATAVVPSPAESGTDLSVPEGIWTYQPRPPVGAYMCTVRHGYGLLKMCDGKEVTLRDRGSGVWVETGPVTGFYYADDEARWATAPEHLGVVVLSSLRGVPLAVFRLVATR